MAPIVFQSRSLKKSRKVLKSKSRSLEWHQLFLPSFGADGHIYSRALGIFNFATIGAKILKLCEIIAVHFLRSNSKLILSPCDKETNAGFSLQKLLPSLFFYYCTLQPNVVSSHSHIGVNINVYVLLDLISQQGMHTIGALNICNLGFQKQQIKNLHLFNQIMQLIVHALRNNELVLPKTRTVRVRAHSMDFHVS